jgi:hypothetical protein
MVFRNVVFLMVTNAQGFASPRWGNSLAVEAQQVVYAGGAVDAGIAMARLQHEQAQVSEQQQREQQRFLALGLCLPTAPDAVARAARALHAEAHTLLEQDRA